VSHLKQGMAVIMGNATVHPLAKTWEILTKADCCMLFRPRYSPELNTIEKA
jgi:transposase